ncbi:Uncharacterized protein At1g28695 [Linum grandiflorum]
MRAGKSSSNRNSSTETTQIRRTLCLLILCLVGLFFVAKLDNHSPSNNLASQRHESVITNDDDDDDELGKVLSEAATADKTLIIATVNRASVEEGDHTPIFDVFLGSFWVGEGTRELVDHLVLVAIDQTAYDRCRFLRLHCYRLVVGEEDRGEEMMYNSPEFAWLMWERVKLLGDVLKRGYSFIFTDIDVLWLRNPFRVLSHNSSIDLQISTEKFNGDEWTPSHTNQMNCGFYMVRSNSRTVSLFEQWYKKKASTTGTGKHEQNVLNEMAWEGQFRDLGVVVRLMDTLYFSGFCQESRDIRLVVTVHANCCRSIAAKVADLKEVVAQWKMFRRDEVAFRHTSVLANMTHMACWMSWM